MATLGREGDLLTAYFCSGPAHVWVGLKLSTDPAVEPHVVERPARGSCFHGPLESARIVDAVKLGTAEMGLHPTHIEYVANDTPRYSIYTHCAYRLAQAAVAEMQLEDAELK